MLARMRKSTNDKDQGFTLIELLVVMIIIGILAAIAIPVFLNQRKKAVDTAAKSDVSTIGKELATYFVDNTGLPTSPTLTVTLGRYVLNGVDIGKQSNKLQGPTLTFNTATAPDTSWCVNLPLVTNAGTLTNVYYSAVAGLSTTTAC